jgi:copper transport protein
MRVFALAICLWLAAALPVAAHSVVERSSPAANTALDAAPDQVELWFNEPVDPAFSAATVVDPSGVRVSERAEVSRDGLKMTVPVRDLARGFYTVRWRVLSRIDGHTTSGVFAFTVGLGVRPPEQFGGQAGPDLGLAFVRWAGFVAVLLAAGAAIFSTFVLPPGLRRLNPVDVLRLEQDVRRRLRAITAIASSAVVVTAGLEVMLRAISLADIPIAQVVAGGQLSLMIWTTKPGWSALVRTAMAILLLLPEIAWGRILRAAGFSWFVLLAGIVALLGGPSALSGSGHIALVILVGTVYGLVSVMAAILLPQIPDFRVPNLAVVPALIGSTMLVGLTMNSHAWGSGLLAVAADAVHLLAAATWIGGLAALTVLLSGVRGEDRYKIASGVVPAFSSVAAVCLGVLVVTGAYSTWLHVPSLGAFTATGYGRYLGAKLLLFLPLAALGAANRFVIRPRLEAPVARRKAHAQARETPVHPLSDAAASSRRFLGVAGAEVGFGALVLLLVALLTATPPARVTTATPALASAALRYQGLAGSVRFSLTVAPSQPGPNQLEVLVGGEPPRAAGESRVFARLVKLDEDVTPITASMAAMGPDRYTAQVTLPAGWWHVEVVLRRRGALDATTSFPLRLGQGAPAATDPSAQRLLEGAQRAMRGIRGWREQEQITDGLGSVIMADADIVPPDRLRIRTSTGAEAVFIGATRYVREGVADWRQERLARAVAAEGVLQYFRGAGSVVAGRQAPCDGETCRVVLWEGPDRGAAFATWIGETTHRIHAIQMVAPQHYMSGRVYDFNAAIRIDAPR